MIKKVKKVLLIFVFLLIVVISLIPFYLMVIMGTHSHAEI